MCVKTKPRKNFSGRLVNYHVLITKTMFVSILTSYFESLAST